LTQSEPFGLKDQHDSIAPPNIEHELQDEAARALLFLLKGE
jgi:hypothetical protein